MSFTGTYYVKAETHILVCPGRVLHDGRAIISLQSENLTIQANCWEDMQRLADALRTGIDQAQRVENGAAASADPA